MTAGGRSAPSGVSSPAAHGSIRSDPARWEAAAEAASAAPGAGMAAGPESRVQARQAGSPRDFARALGILTVCAGIGVGTLLFVLGEIRGAIGISVLVICIGAGFLIISALRPSPSR